MKEDKSIGQAIEANDGIQQLQDMLANRSSSYKPSRYNPVGLAVIAFLLMVTGFCIALAYGVSKIIDWMWF